MSGADAAAAAANAAAAAANVAAMNATRASCAAFVRGYSHDKAAVAEMREYAGCIDRLYPKQMADLDIGIAKAIVIFIIMSALFGVVYEVRNRVASDSALGALFFGCWIGLLIGCSVLVLVGAFAFGVTVLMA